MFSGITDHCGVIKIIAARDQTLRVLIECKFTDLVAGESIAVDGMCVTAIAPQAQQFYCDISPETLRLTTANSFTVGRTVNLERALRMNDRIGGHWVTGHIDQRGAIKTIEQQQEFTLLEITGIAPENKSFLIKKGSVAVNGVSLTINEITPEGFQVMLIPHTLSHTNLGQLKNGAEINLEFDWMARVIINHLQQSEMLAVKI
jgi:riboflavin synthase